MKIKERIEQQANQVVELVRELENEKSYKGIERLVQLTIQALLDLGIMVISALGGRTPKVYSEVGMLVEAGLLSENDAKILRSMAGMRNISVHSYTIIDKEIVIDSAKKLVRDAPRIADVLKAGLKDKPVDPPVSNTLRGSLRELFKGKVRTAFLFGSRAKGYSFKDDYDVAVYFGRPITYMIWENLL
ncbi:MAG: HepT-like ribonuclease domain-containing protein [Candidatus Bathyarchaeia archaeon]